MSAQAVGIDLGKTTFHLVALDSTGQVVEKKKCSRPQLLRRMSNLSTQVVGMEACAGAHWLAQALTQQGHHVRLLPPQYVRPYVKTNKNDFVDAEAIAEAVQRPTMRFVPIKTEAQLDLQALHRTRQRWMGRSHRHAEQGGTELRLHAHEFLQLGDIHVLERRYLHHLHPSPHLPEAVGDQHALTAPRALTAGV